MKHTTLKARVSRGVSLGLGLALIAGGTVATAAPAAAVESPRIGAADIAADASDYYSWHQGYTGVTDSFSDADGALQIKGKSQLFVGILDGKLPLDSLSTAVSNGLVSLATSGDELYFQIAVNYGADGFTTLRPAVGATSAHTVSLDDTWTFSRAIGDNAGGGTTLAPLRDILAMLDVADGDDPLLQARTTGFGVLNNPDTTALLQSISWDGTTYTFGGPVVPELQPGTVAISGSPVVGQTLTATTAGWPEGTTFSYQWSVSFGQSGSSLNGTNSYVVEPSTVNGKIGVQVIGTLGSKTAAASTLMTTAVSAPQAPAATPPVSNSADLAAFLASQNVTPVSQQSVGLPAGAISSNVGHTATLNWSAGDSFVDVYAFSTPVLVGTFPVVNGVVQITLSPALLAKIAAGAHTLVITGQTSGATTAVSFVVAAPTGALAATGSETVLPLTAASIMLLLGAAVLVLRRRQAARV